MIIVGRQYTETETSKTREDAPSHTSKKKVISRSWCLDGRRKYHPCGKAKLIKVRPELGDDILTTSRITNTKPRPTYLPFNNSTEGPTGTYSGGALSDATQFVYCEHIVSPWPAFQFERDLYTT